MGETISNIAARAPNAQVGSQFAPVTQGKYAPVVQPGKAPAMFSNLPGSFNPLSLPNPYNPPNVASAPAGVVPAKAHHGFPWMHRFPTSAPGGGFAHHLMGGAHGGWGPAAFGTHGMGFGAGSIGTANFPRVPNRRFFRAPTTLGFGR